MSAPYISQFVSYLLPLVAGLLVGFLSAKQPRDLSADGAGEAATQLPRLTALGGPSPEARVRQLLNDKSPPSELWDALQSCDSEALARLYEAAGREFEGNARMRLLMVATRWLEIEPEAACRAAAAEWDGFMALSKVAGIWGTSDPDAALSFLLDYPGINGNGFAIGATISGSRLIPGFDTRQLLDRLSPYHDSTKISFELTEGNRLENLRELIVEPEELSLKLEEIADSGLEDFVDAALESAPASELIALYSEPGGKRLGEPSSTLVAAYFKQDPAAAKDWIFNQHDEFHGAYTGNELVTEMMEESPASAADVIAELPESGARTESLIELAESWRATDGDGYQAWYLELGLPDRSAIDASFEPADEEGME